MSETARILCTTKEKKDGTYKTSLKWEGNKKGIVHVAKELISEMSDVFQLAVDKYDLVAVGGNENTVYMKRRKYI